MDYEQYLDARFFSQKYRCYATSRPHVEAGDRIIMPESALDRLASLLIHYPIQLNLHSAAHSKKATHCGVLEFVAEEGFVFLPSWMMDNVGLEEGELVELNSVDLPNAAYVKLQPHKSDFLDIPDQKKALEESLKRFSCLTTGDTIVVECDEKKYCIDVLETRPLTAVSMVETDCEVEFAAPLDYKEVERLGKDCSSASGGGGGSEKVLFGSSSERERKWKRDVPGEAVQAFSGKKFSLRD